MVRCDDVGRGIPGHIGIYDEFSKRWECCSMNAANAREIMKYVRHWAVGNRNEGIIHRNAS